MAQLLGVPAETVSPGKMIYDLRRLRMHGLKTPVTQAS